jgi:hypothetical protein
MPLSRLWTKWVHRRNSKTAERRREADLIDVIERAVQESDPVIRNLRNYRKELRKPVESALAYIEGLVAAITGPVDLSPDHWDKDPLLRALFVAPDEAAALARSSAELSSFFDRHPQARDAIAILTATRNERTIFGTALEGDILRRDVPQVAVEFVNLRVVAPALTEAEARREIKVRTLQLLAATSLQHMVELRSLREELTEQRHILEVKLKIQQSRPDRLECTLGENGTACEERDPGGEALAEIDRRLMDLDPDTLSAQAHLDHLAEDLTHPERAMAVRVFSLNLNWMGVKLDAAAASRQAPITLAELDIKDRLKRIAVLVRVSRETALGR